MTVESHRWKRAVAVLAIGGATLVLGGVAVQSVWAQQTPTPVPTRPGPRGGMEQRHEQYLAALARRLNVSTDQLKEAMQQARQEIGIPQGPGGRRGGPGGPGGPGHGPFGAALNTAAGAIGISGDQLRKELRGKSLADVAKAHNVDSSKVSDALKTEASTRIDQAVSAGRLPADRAAQIKSSLSQRIDEMMTRQLPADAPTWRGPRPS